VVIKQAKKADVWLGGQDIVEGMWTWSNAGNQALSNDLLWAPGNHYFTMSFLFAFFSDTWCVKVKKASTVTRQHDTYNYLNAFDNVNYGINFVFDEFT